MALTAAAGHAATAVGTITDVWSYANGNVVVTGLNFGTTGCSNSHGFIVEYGSNGYSTIMATLLSARAMGAQIEVNASVTSGCWYPTIASGGSDYVRLLGN